MEEPGWLLECLLQNVPSRHGRKDADAVWTLRSAQDRVAQDAGRALAHVPGMEALGKRISPLLRRPYSPAQITGLV